MNAREARATGEDRRPPLFTKRLVAHAPDRDEELGYGPVDGDPVGVPAPCSRLIAGYWCSCGSGFASFRNHEEIPRARVELDPEHDWAGFTDSFGGFFEPGARWPTEDDRRDLQRAVDALPVGTVVERFGPGIAPRFERPAPRDYREWPFTERVR